MSHWSTRAHRLVLTACLLVACGGGGTRGAGEGTGAAGAPPFGQGGAGVGAPASAGAAGAAGVEQGPLECTGGTHAVGSSGSSPAPRCSAASAHFASSVVAHEFGPGQDLGQDEFPERVLGPPEGGGCCQGSVDAVVSLGNGGWVVLAFEDNAIVDGPGPDFIVYENAFFIGGNQNNVFAELASVAVSDDGEHWVEFPCTASEPPYGQCAGWHPTLANAETNDIDPGDPLSAGGDAYDLGDVCMPRARFVRSTDRIDLDAELDGVFDLDAAAIVNGACESER